MHGSGAQSRLTVPPCLLPCSSRRAVAAATAVASRSKRPDRGRVATPAVAPRGQSFGSLLQPFLDVAADPVDAVRCYIPGCVRRLARRLSPPHRSATTLAAAWALTCPFDVIKPQQAAEKRLPVLVLEMPFPGLSPRVKPCRRVLCAREVSTEAEARMGEVRQGQRHLTGTHPGGSRHRYKMIYQAIHGAHFPAG